MVSVDTERIKTRMRLRAMSIVGLAQAAGLSRQAIYQILRPGYRPLSPGIEAVARALEIDPLDLLAVENKSRRKQRAVEELAHKAAGGDARAFEVLPAGILGLSAAGLLSLDVTDPIIHQILAAAGQIARTFSDRPCVDDFIRLHAANTRPGHAFFFGESLIEVERLVSLTPGPMRLHRVCGVFEMDSFRRHLS